ncbi:BQ2448_4929 [Microbotryum intermedium]|uniref:BQ2448_4929 protein n=1 Tax=Microbotryum intermedium TaxID=269621 RepID=A0A238FGC2_9BASI|nr:BQ2448_4929 [Microbotryum intermedium]
MIATLGPTSSFGSSSQSLSTSSLYLTRWHRHKDQTPLPTAYLLAREVRSHLKFRLRRLLAGERLEQLM